MSKLTCVMVDDEQDAIDALTLQLKHLGEEVKILGSFNDIPSGFKGITTLKPDLVFLDIELGTDNSFELLDLFDTINFKIIFVTGHNAFAIKAIKFSALDYLLNQLGA